MNQDVPCSLLTQCNNEAICRESSQSAAAVTSPGITGNHFLLSAAGQQRAARLHRAFPKLSEAPCPVRGLLHSHVSQRLENALQLSLPLFRTFNIKKKNQQPNHFVPLTKTVCFPIPPLFSLFVPRVVNCALQGWGLDCTFLLWVMNTPHSHTFKKLSR